jgi:hypothetical protein
MMRPTFSRTTFSRRFRRRLARKGVRSYRAQLDRFEGYGERTQSYRRLGRPGHGELLFRPDATGTRGSHEGNHT